MNTGWNSSWFWVNGEWGCKSEERGLTASRMKNVFRRNRIGEKNWTYGCKGKIEIRGNVKQQQNFPPPQRQLRLETGYF